MGEKEDFVNLREAKKRREAEHESGEPNRKQMQDDS